MKRVFVMFFVCWLSVYGSWAVEAADGSLQSIDTMVINKDMSAIRLAENAYIYTAWADVGSWGRVGSNGLILVDGGRVFMVDTPMHQRQTKELVRWIKSELGAQIVSFVPGHWHDDCVGGMDYLNKHGVQSYAGLRTDEVLKAKGLPRAKHTFEDSITLHLGNIAIECHYLGGGHATDNIVVWVPSLEILFGGCMVKDCATDSIGNTADAAPLDEWLGTICKVEAKFPQAKIIIPGHGKTGGAEILSHTKEVIINNMK